MGLNKSIHIALDTEVRTLVNAYAGTSSIPIHFENVTNTSHPDELYVETFLLPATPAKLTLGQNPEKRHPGVYQVSINGVKNTGYADAYDLADSLIDSLEGSILTHGDHKIRIDQAYVTPPISSEGDSEIGRYILPLTINYYSYSSGE